MTTFLLIRHGETDANGARLSADAGWQLNAR
jgi:broad specificity phosphatase PhoE